ncbi:hypothetical protein [Halobellus ordinarius]|uniref:hypothetical protein n=1 Tax=Halobellus ordinarius TaxID=3075120 RepID=UPI00288000F8|nr:hypothetical protein [Halobellus sp. ZY16]
MEIVTAVAFAVGTLSIYYGLRALKTRRAIRRLRGDSGLVGHPTDWLDAGETKTEDAAPTTRDRSFERGVVLLALGLLCLLFGILAL